MPISAIREFLKFEAAGGILLVIASVAALILANSPFGGLYSAFLETPVAVQVGKLEIAKPLLLWINDGLMAIFFFLVGLEIKREFLEGELSRPSQFALPALAAVGGMAVPGIIYYLINMDQPANLNGWAIPTATDIAFALGILALVGSRAPLSLKVLLTAIAIIDDLGAIIIIALFYTENMSVMALMTGGVALVGLVVANMMRVTRVSVYVVLGIFLWVCVLKSGVHATLAGVITALAIPLRVQDEDGHSLLTHLEHQLHPWVAYLILPVFAFANAGVSFAGIGVDSFREPVQMGISMGLFVGKQIGVFLTLVLCIKLGIAAMPRGATWLQLYAVSLLCGIGFTMSLFLGALAFDDPSFDVSVRLGVLTGSILSAILGFVLLRFLSPPPEATDAVNNGG